RLIFRFSPAKSIHYKCFFIWKCGILISSTKTYERKKRRLMLYFNYSMGRCLMSKKEMGLLSETESLVRLLYRLPENHPKRQFLQVELFRTAAGKRGEKRLEQKLKEFRLAENHRFLRNICLSKGEWRIQMDGLLLTERGAIIIESKNISGQLFFDDKTGEFSRIDLEG